jgi:2'-5' RNA ligase
MPESARLFFALDVPKPAIDEVFQLQSRLRAFAERFDPRWTRREQVHLTLKFLGDVEISKLDELTRLTEECARDTRAFDVSFERLAAFPNARRARVLAIELSPDPRLAELATRLEQAVERFGIPRERRPFRPHLTLARFKTPGNAAFLLDSASLPRTSLRLNVLRLYQSLRGEYSRTRTSHCPAERSSCAEPRHSAYSAPSRKEVSCTKTIQPASLLRDPPFTREREENGFSPRSEFGENSLIH